jgi:imidazoleglycerol phosphate synthase glutamine amidotransferase subunit HisH
MKNENKIGTEKVEEDTSIMDMCRMQCFIYYMHSYEMAIQEFSTTSVVYGVLETNFSPGAFFAAGDLADELLDV